MGRAGSPLLKGTMRYGTGTVRQYSTVLYLYAVCCRFLQYWLTMLLKVAKSGSENSLRLPTATAKAAYFLRGVLFADARERFTGTARTFFSFSAGKRRMLLLGGREAVNEGGSEGL